MKKPEMFFEAKTHLSDFEPDKNMAKDVSKSVGIPMLKARHLEQTTHPHEISYLVGRLDYATYSHLHTWCKRHLLISNKEAFLIPPDKLYVLYSLSLLSRRKSAIGIAVEDDYYNDHVLESVNLNSQRPQAHDEWMTQMSVLSTCIEYATIYNMEIWMSLSDIYI